MQGRILEAIQDAPGKLVRIWNVSIEILSMLFRQESVVIANHVCVENYRWNYSMEF